MGKREESRTKERLAYVIKFGPLLAAIFAPLSVLLSLVGLSERWFLLNNKPVSDPGASLALSALTLAANLIANALLVLRFTVNEKWWRKAFIGSVFNWWLNLIIHLVNLCVYGRFTRNELGYKYSEGFWASVGAVTITGLITLVLTLHLALRWKQPVTEGRMIRVAGAEFIMIVSIFIATLALQGLIFSRIEGWTFFQGVYFSLVTAFTIGFGDFQPSKTSTRILNFFFAVWLIALLSVSIGTIISFISVGTSRKLARWRQEYEERFMAESHEGREGTGRKALVEEVADLQKMEDRETRMEGAFNFAISLAALLVFWVIGGAVFWALEGWAFGSSLYFCYVFTFTIGYGDYSPTTAGGRVFFVIYTLLAVPVVTNFVLNTVSSLLSSLTARRFERQKDRRAPTTAEKRMFHSHAHNVSQSRERLQKGLESEIDLAKVILGLAVRLEAEASTLLVHTLPEDGPGKKAQLLLRADRNLQRRAIRQHGGESSKHPSIAERHALLALEEDDTDEAKDSESVTNVFADPVTGEPDVLELVRRYRETSAGILAAGSLLLRLEDKERWLFERRLEREEEEDHGGILLGSGREGPAERAMGVDV